MGKRLRAKDKDECSIIVNMMKRGLEEAISNVIHDVVGLEVNVELFRPENIKFGDWTSNVALMTYGRLSPDLKGQYKSVRAWAEHLCQQLKQHLTLDGQIERIEVAGPGFINFYWSTAALVEQIIQQLFFDEQQVEGNETVIVEYSSPNIAKSFTVGHLRSTVIGDAIANLLEAAGKKVRRDNHLGDWGTQFAKQVVAIEKWGNWQEIEQSEQPIKELVRLYVKFHQEAEKKPELEDEARETFRKMEANEAKIIAMWQKIVDISMKEFNKLYEILQIKFTENGGKGYGESFARDKTETVVEQLKAKHLLIESQGAQVVEFAPEDKLPPFLILKKDGATLYQTRDLAMDFWRKQAYGEGITIINEVGREQSLYFRQLYRVEELLGWYQPTQRLHVGHGLYRFKDRKMSTRKGDVVWLEDILTAAMAKVKTVAKGNLSDDDVRVIAVGAIKWNDLSREAQSDIDFDLDKMIALKGNCGPYMQYTVRRCLSVLEKAGSGLLNEIEGKILINQDKLQEESENIKKSDWQDSEKKLLTLLTNYQETVARAAQALAPNLVATYLYELAQEFNNYYAKVILMGATERLWLTAAIGLTLTKGLKLLGIEIPKQM